MNVDPERIDVSADREPAARHLALDACPYLLSRDLRVRHATAWRGHRCTAIEPAAALSPEKQRRLCLTADHTSCATFIAAEATASRSTSATGDGAVPQGRATRWALARTTPVVEAASPLDELLDRARDSSTQLALAGLLVLALVAVGFGQFGRPPVDGSRPSPSPSQPVAVATASPTASPTPTVAPPTPTPTASPGPVATSTPTPTASTTYTVKAGDTLWDIAIQFGTSVAAIQELNGLGTSTRLVVGQVLKIP